MKFAGYVAPTLTYKVAKVFFLGGVVFIGAPCTRQEATSVSQRGLPPSVERRRRCDPTPC